MVEFAVFVVALGTRLSMVLTSHGGLFGDYRYDAGVYYAAADALTFGRLPYRDFVLLHPPGITLALTPFAWIGRLTTDQAGFVSGDLAFTVLGAVNAVLVVRIARRMGLPSRAALLGGLFYALWMGSVGAEFLSRLEPLGAFWLLCALLALLTARAAEGRRRTLSYLLAGAALGAAMSVKIWWVVPAAVLLAGQAAWQARRGAGHRAGLPVLAAGLAGALVLVDGPFFLAAPTTMWHMVVTEQLGRARETPAALVRLGGLTSLTRVIHLSTPTADALTLALVGLFTVVLALAWRVSAARMLVVLLVAQLVVLLRAPSWYTFYSDYLTPAAALCVAAASAQARRRWLRTLVPAVPVLCVLLAGTATLGYQASGENTMVVRAGTRSLAADLGGIRCVMSPTPMGLILTDTLSRGLRDGCRDWVDVGGRGYGVAPGQNSHAAPHMHHAHWQRVLRRYLLSGQAVVLVPDSGPTPDARTLDDLGRGGLLARSGREFVYRTPPDIARPAGDSRA